MSASSTPTFCPGGERGARLTVTDDPPPRPTPLATASTRVSDDGWANGIAFTAAAAGRVLQLAALLFAHHVQLHRHRDAAPRTRQR
jgi:hypothetical protein